MAARPKRAMGLVEKVLAAPVEMIGPLPLPFSPLEPGLLDPGELEPGVLDPGVLDPGVLDPGVLEPGVVEPGMFEPGVLDPGALPPLLPVLVVPLLEPGVPGTGTGATPGLGQGHAVEPGCLHGYCAGVLRNVN